MAAACLFVMNLDQSLFTPSSPAHFTPSFLNIGTGKDQTIAEIAKMIQETIGFKGETVFDSNKPDGTPKKLLDTTRINELGWQPCFKLKEGLMDAYEWYLRKN
jgi:nucleoside-diphosphate-sugar epimerase